MALRYRKAKVVLNYLDDKPVMYHVQQIRPGKVDLDTLVKEIEHSENVTETQTRAVIYALINRIAHYLELNYLVGIDSLGSFKLNMNAKAAKKIDEATAETIKKVGVRFIAGKKLREVAKTVQIEHYGSALDDDE